MEESVKLPRIFPKTLSGDEKFTYKGNQEDYKVIDFWRWSVSDLVSNATRGRLAEFIVAKALEIPLDGVRDEWQSYDLKMANGTTIEVKSASYIQSWDQNDYSKISFLTRKTRAWDKSNIQEKESHRHAQVYVFALLSHKDKKTINPLILDQWKFFILPTRELDERKRSQHSITLPSLIKLCGDGVDYHDLKVKVLELSKV